MACVFSYQFMSGGREGGGGLEGCDGAGGMRCSRDYEKTELLQYASRISCRLSKLRIFFKAFLKETHTSQLAC